MPLILRCCTHKHTQSDVIYPLFWWQSVGTFNQSKSWIRTCPYKWSVIERSLTAGWHSQLRGHPAAEPSPLSSLQRQRSKKKKKIQASVASHYITQKDEALQFPWTHRALFVPCKRDTELSETPQKKQSLIHSIKSQRNVKDAASKVTVSISTTCIAVKEAVVTVDGKFCCHNVPSSTQWCTHCCCEETICAKCKVASKAEGASSWLSIQKIIILER